MAGDEYLRVIQFFFAVGVLWVWYGFMYKRTRTDRLREDLFTIRDELFDFMWRHGLSYDLPAYQQMRDFLNGGIRFADKLNLVPLWLVAHLARGMHPHKEFSLPKAIEEIEDPETKAYFEKVYRTVGRRLYRCVFLEGPYWPLFKPVQIIRRVKHLTPVRDKPEIQAMSEDLMRWGMRKSPEALAILGSGPKGGLPKAA